MAITLAEINGSLGRIEQSQDKTTEAVQSVADKISAQMEMDEKNRLSELNRKANETADTKVGSAGKIGKKAAAGFGLLGGLLGGMGGGLLKGAGGVAALGLALPAFFGGLMLGDKGLKWLESIGADFNFESLKKAAIGFSNMILELDPMTFTVLAGIMGISAIGGKDAAIGLGAMGLAISAFIGGILAGDQAFKWIEGKGVSLDFASLKKVFVGFSDAVTGLSPEGIIALGSIVGISGLAAMFGASAKDGLEIAAIMTGIGGGIAGLMIGLTAGNVATTWLDKVTGLNGDGLKNAFKVFNDSVGMLNNENAIKALISIIGAGAGIGAFLGAKGALGAGVGIFAVMSGIGAGIAGLMIGISAGGKITDAIESLKIGDGDGFTSIIRMFNDMIMAISPEAVDKMADISKRNIGGGLASLAGGIVAMLGAEGLGEVGNLWKTGKEALLGAVDWLFGTDLAGKNKKSTLEQIIEGLEPVNKLPTEMISKIDQFGGAISGLADSFANLQNISVEKSTSNLSRMIRDVAGVLELWPHLTGDNPEPYDPPGWNMFGKDKISFGGGLKNLKEADVKIVESGLKSLRSALGVDTETTVKASEVAKGISTEVSIVKISDDVLTALTAALMQKDYTEKTSGGLSFGGSYTDARTTSYNSSTSTGLVMPMGQTVDILDGGRR